MAFKLDSVVPWGRNMEEYKLMFRLDDNDMSKKLQGLAMVQPVLIMRWLKEMEVLFRLIWCISFRKKI